MPVKTQYFPHEINIPKIGHLTDIDLQGFTKTLKAIKKLHKSGLIDLFIIPHGVITIKEKTTITIKLYEDGVMPGGFHDR